MVLLGHAAQFGANRGRWKGDIPKTRYEIQTAASETFGSGSTVDVPL
jgi:hypothetical protein